MLPLVTRVDEVTATRELVAEEAVALAAAGVRAASDLPVGVMIETPAAAILADRLAEVCDFFSVGTNDLTQYTLAVDRGNARLAHRFTPHDPAVVRQLASVLAAADRAGIPVQRLRRDGLGPPLLRAARGPGLHPAQRGAADAAADEVGGAAVPYDVVRRGRGRARWGCLPPRRSPPACGRRCAASSTCACSISDATLPGRSSRTSFP